jgi:hypothetical protein
MAPTMRKASEPFKTASGRGVSGGFEGEIFFARKETDERPVLAPAIRRQDERAFFAQTNTGTPLTICALV